MKLDQDIVAAAKRIQELRKEGKLIGVKFIVLHVAPDDNKIKKVHTETKESYAVGK